MALFVLSGGARAVVVGQWSHEVRVYDAEEAEQ